MSRSRTFDVAVVVPTVGRETLSRAVESIFAQEFSGTIHILVGVDVDMFERCSQIRDSLTVRCPSHMMLTWLDLGYSTSRRHGGIHSCQFGGSLRSILTMCAQSEVVAYLDDDDWYERSHLEKMSQAICDRKWAYSLCWYADGNSGRQLCVDEVESVGPDKGVFRKLGGFVRPSALSINKLALSRIVPLWAYSALPTGDGEDRIVFSQLRKERNFGSTGVPTVCYALDPKDAMHPLRQKFMKFKGVDYKEIDKAGSVR